jgi:hypothetical protein
MRFSTFAHNGTSYQTSSTSTLRAVVDASYTANGANIPIGWQLVVNDTNGGINNQSKTHNFYSNGNVTFAQYVNATGFAGEGGNLSNIQGANVSGTVANATYAANAGNANIANTANSVAVANVSGIGNIATINLDGSSSNVLYGNGVFAPESTNIANANYANFAGTLINGNSNVNITTNANINMNVSGNANVVQIDGNGSIFTTPLAGGYNNWLRINNYGTSANGNSAFASRISSFRFRGNSTAPLSVQPGDGTIDIITLGHNGTSIQSNSLARIRATVDSSYTANGANIPIGWQVVVNGTNGGVNNQQKTHNFYSNGNVAFGGNVTSLNVTGDIGVANVVMSGSAFIGTTLDVVGNTELKNYVTIYPANLTTGLANLTVYNGNVDVANNGAGTGGTVNLVNLRGFANVFGALSSNGYFYCTTIRATSTIGGDVDLRLPTAGAANIQMYAANGAVTTIGTVTAANVQISANGFTKLASYTAAALTAITGQIGWIAAVSNSAGGAHPNGMIAFWDTTNTRWSYIHDNSAV